MDTESSLPIVIAVSGASGSAIARSLLELLLKYTGATIHLVISNAAAGVWQHELPSSPPPESDRIVRFHPHELMAPIASGSYPTRGMIIAPCSMGTLGKIAHGIAENLIIRAADVTIKERRPLIVAPRESPLSAIHLANMLTLANAGATIAPPMITLYNAPASTDAMIEQFSLHILQLLGLRVPRQQWDPSTFRAG